MALRPEATARKLRVGRERAPLLVIDDFASEPEPLVRTAARKPFGQVPGFFPGIRAEAPLSYQHYVIGQLRDLLLDFFELEGSAIRFTMCHYSLVTTPPAKLAMPQRIPHVDSLERHGLASIHYLFRGGYGGTAFYRHRKTGFETLDEPRSKTYFRSLESENDGPNLPAPEYINGDTPLFEQIAREDGVFNRLLVYRRNSLHSGCIDRDFVPDPNPLTGRLSINSFLDAVP